MKQLLKIKFVIVIMFFAFVQTNYAQWYTNGSSIVYTTDNVGIGTTSPQDKLDIHGNIRFSSNADRRIYGASRASRNTVVLDGNWDELEIKGRVIDWTGSNLHIGYDNNHSSHAVYFGNGKLGKVHIQGSTNFIVENGKTGIGTTSPISKLHVQSSACGPTNPEYRCAIYGYNTSNETSYKNPVGLYGKVNGSSGAAIYGQNLNSSGYGGYFIGKGYFSGKVTIGNMVGNKEFSHGLQIWGPGTLGAEGRLLFGDNHDIDLGWRNVLVGENGDTDTDQLLLHGRNGIYFSTGRGGADNLGLITTRVYIDPEGKMVVKNKIETEEIEVKEIASNTLKTNTIEAEDINVSVNHVADYVFEENYELSSLSEVEKYVKENKHLPGIPAGEEFEENGMNVAEMNNLLLQKVEELTLYVIDLEKQINRLKNEK